MEGSVQVQFFYCVEWHPVLPGLVSAYNSSLWCDQAFGNNAQPDTARLRLSTFFKQQNPASFDSSKVYATIVCASCRWLQVRIPAVTFLCNAII